MHISISTINFDSRRFSIEQTLKMIENMSATTIDLATFENWQGIYPSHLLDNNEWDRIANMLVASPLKVDAINAGFMHQVTCARDADFETITQHFITLCALAQTVKARNITIGPGHMENRQDVDLNVKRLLKRLPKWYEIAKTHDVSLSLECHANSTLEHMHEVEYVMAALKGKIGLTFDPSHLEMQSILLSDAQPVMQYVSHAHIRCASKDHMQDTAEGNTLDIKKSLDMLHDCGYEGNIAIEYFNDFDGGKQLPLMICQLQAYGLEL